MSKERQQQSTPVNSTPASGDSQLLSRTETIERLQETIGQLEGIINQLRAESAANLPPKTAIEALVDSTQILAKTVADKPSLTATPEEKVPEKVAQAQPTTPVTKTPASVFPKTPAGSPPPTRKPASLGKKLFNWRLLGIITGVVLVLILAVILVRRQPTTEIATIPPQIEIPQQVETPPIASEQPEPSEISPPLPPQLEAPALPQAGELAPPPQAKLTPEQSLIAAIQEQVAEITSEYAEGLILSIEANFLRSRLLVTVGDDWDELDSPQQEKLANEMLSRSRQLDFQKLAIQDTTGRLLARSPVVGEKMLIL